jgi:Fe-S-cluster containining protein
MNDMVAVITLDPKNQRITDLRLAQKQFKFKCKRCANLCCKLGGPLLTQKDVEMIEYAGYHLKDFLEPINQNPANLTPIGGLKTNADGSCIFLQFDTEQNRFQCGIYDHRPTLCRLYPFRFESLGSNLIILKFIPCCMGLNNPKGKVLDRTFVSDRLLEPLLEIINLSQKDLMC